MKMIMHNFDKYKLVKIKFNARRYSETRWPKEKDRIVKINNAMTVDEVLAAIEAFYNKNDFETFLLRYGFYM